MHDDGPAVAGSVWPLQDVGEVGRIECHLARRQDVRLPLDVGIAAAAQAVPLLAEALHPAIGRLVKLLRQPQGPLGKMQLVEMERWSAQAAWLEPRLLVK